MPSVVVPALVFPTLKMPGNVVIQPVIVDLPTPALPKKIFAVSFPTQEFVITFFAGCFIFDINPRRPNDKDLILIKSFCIFDILTISLICGLYVFQKNSQTNTLSKFV